MLPATLCLFSRSSIHAPLRAAHKSVWHSQRLLSRAQMMNFRPMSNQTSPKARNNKFLFGTLSAIGVITPVVLFLTSRKNSSGQTPPLLSTSQPTDTSTTKPTPKPASTKFSDSSSESDSSITPNSPASPDPERKDDVKTEMKQSELTNSSAVPASPPPTSEVSASSTTESSHNSPSSPAETSSIAPPPPLHIKYVLVGGGTASFTAMRAIMRSDPTNPILIISDEELAPYVRTPLSKELWFSEADDVAETLSFKSWNGFDKNLLYASNSFYEVLTDAPPTDSSKQVKLMLGRQAVSLDAESQVITLDNGQIVHYEKLLIATGGKPKELPLMSSLSNDIKKHVTTYRKVADFRQLDQLTRKDAHVVVIGGGFLGSELACALAHRSQKNKQLKVTQIFPEDGNMGMVFPKYLSNWTTQTLKNEGIEILHQATLQKIDSRVEDGKEKVVLTLNDGRELTVDHVVVAVGLEPNVELARSAGLEIDDTRGGIIANAELEARSNIFVAGDVSSYHDIALGRRRVEHHDHAVLSGRAAGENMAGARRLYNHQSMFWSDLGPNIGYEAVGILDSKLVTMGVWAKASVKDTPQQAANQSNNIRSSDTDDVQDSSDQQSVAEQPTNVSTSTPPEANQSENFGKGVVFYMKDKRVVGMLMWNLFNRVPIARKIIKEGKQYDDISELAKLMRIYE